MRTQNLSEHEERVSSVKVQNGHMLLRRRRYRGKKALLYRSLGGKVQLSGKPKPAKKSPRCKREPRRSYSGPRVLKIGLQLRKKRGLKSINVVREAILTEKNVPVERKACQKEGVRRELTFGQESDDEGGK